MNRQRQESGFAMIEVMLAVVILAIGLLAGSKMQILGMNYTQGAMMRSHATVAVNDIIDRMRINAAGVKANHYNSFDSSTSSPTKPNCVGTTSGCSPSDLATYDLWVFNSYFADGALHNAVGTISEPNATTGIRTVKVAWGELIEGSSEQREVSIGVFLP